MKLPDINLIIDFDSTFVKVEGLEELAKISLRNRPDRDYVISRIKEITDQGMAGEIMFQESLQKRLELFCPHKSNIATLTELLKQEVTPSVLDSRSFFKENADNIYIISGGFKDWILPVVRDFGITDEHVLANDFLYEEHGSISGIDLNNPLTRSGGKGLSVDALRLPGKIVVIGDGFTDYEIKSSGFADMFVMFTENVRRPKVEKLADIIAEDWNKVLSALQSSTLY